MDSSAKEETRVARDERGVRLRIMRLCVCVAMLQSIPWALLDSIIASQVTESLCYIPHILTHTHTGLALHPNDFTLQRWLTTCLFYSLPFGF